jgi:hypothetical protein
MHAVRDGPVRNWNRLDGFTDAPQDRMTKEIVCGSGDRILPDGRCRIDGPRNDSARLIPSESSLCGLLGSVAYSAGALEDRAV